MNDVSLPRLSVLGIPRWPIGRRDRATGRSRSFCMAIRPHPSSGARFSRSSRQWPVRINSRPHPALASRARPIHRLSFEDPRAILMRSLAKMGIGSALSRRSGLGNGPRLSPRRAALRISCAASRSWSSSGLGPNLRSVRAQLASARGLPQIPNARRRGETDPRQEHSRRTAVAGRHATQADGRRDGGLSRAISDAESRRPTRRFPSELLIAGEPADISADDGARPCGARDH